jgi:hypothetical protein
MNRGRYFDGELPISYNTILDFIPTQEDQIMLVLLFLLSHRKRSSFMKNLYISIPAFFLSSILFAFLLTAISTKRIQYMTVRPTFYISFPSTYFSLISSYNFKCHINILSLELQKKLLL